MRSWMPTPTENEPVEAWRNERTLYTGDHYIEIYIVKNGVCVAQDRLEVPIG